MHTTVCLDYTWQGASVSHIGDILEGVGVCLRRRQKWLEATFEAKRVLRFKYTSLRAHVIVAVNKSFNDLEFVK